jgi:outer membrane protein OmpA-like peptidoglycan-associated protein/5-hydroxyisourate hydrolase-like protein (transthyretin family)
MRQAIRFLIVAVCLFIHLSGWGQTGNVRTNLRSALSRADLLFEDYAYSSAVEWYKVALRKSPDNYEIIQKIAECYRKLNDPRQAEEWYTQLAAHQITMAPEYKLYYAQALQRNGKYQEALHWFQEYLSDGMKDGRVSKQINGLNKSENYYRDSSLYRIKELSINSAGSDFGPGFFHHGLVFVSAQRQTALIRQVHSWDDSPLLDLYYSAFQADGSLAKPQPFDRQINSKLHEGPATFFDQDRKMIFTRSNFLEGKLGKSQEGVSKLKLFYAEQSGKRWVVTDAFPFNSNEYSVGHPTVSSDGKTLYFVSDMPGGYGGMDVYVSTNENGVWSAPLNLGNQINTEGNEMFPFLFADQVLYFSSDGHGGLGGMDIYKTTLPLTTDLALIVNLGYPINTQSDDFAFILDNKNENGYFASNRKGGKGKDDLYQVELQYLQLEILTADAQTGDTLSDANLRLFDSNTHVELTGSKQGAKVVYKVTPGIAVIVKAQKDRYSDQTLFVPTAGKQPGDKLTLRVSLEKERVMNKPLLVHCYDQQSGKPISNAKVYLLNEFTSEEQHLQTDADGNLTFQAQLSDSYALIVDKDQQSGMMTGIRPDSVQATIQLPVRNVYHQTERGMAAYVVLSVGIQDAATKQPLSEVQVHVQEGTMPIRKGISQANGTAFFKLEKNKLYILRSESKAYEKKVAIITPNQSADKDTLQITWMLEGTKPENILNLQVYDNQTGESLGEQEVMALERIIDTAVDRIQLPKRRMASKAIPITSMTLDVSVRDAADKSRLDGAVVKLFEGSAYKAITVSERDGRAELKIQSGGNYVLKIFKEGYQNKILIVTAEGRQPGEVLSLRANMERPREQSKSLQVHCYDQQSGKPISNAKVYLLNEFTSEEQHLQTDADGNLTFQAQLTDSYALIVDKDQQSGMMTGIRPDSVQKVRIPVRKLRQQTGRELAHVLVAVQIEEADTRQPLSEVVVHVQEGTSPRQKAVSQDNGYLIFRLPVSERHLMKFEKENYRTKMVVVAPQGKEKDTIQLLIRLEKPLVQSKPLLVHCYDQQSGKPISNAKVYLLNEFTSEEQHLQTDADGNLTFRAQLTDSYALVVDKDNQSGMMTGIRPDSVQNRIRLPLRTISQSHLTAPTQPEIVASNKVTQSGDFSSEATRVDSSLPSVKPTQVNRSVNTPAGSAELAKARKLQKNSYANTSRNESTSLDEKTLEATLTLPSLYYRTDKYAVARERSRQLDSVAAFMKANRQYKLVISSYTDSRQSHWYNEQLSAKRSQTARQYLITRGIEKKRIVAKYFGERKLVNDCTDGVFCDESQHQQNRRTDFFLYLPE